jgi:pyridoxal phosphate enzyme (YggS family)
MIGHLQSRKVKYVVEHFDMMHSLDSLRLAEKLDRSLGEAGKRLPVLLEVNVGNEASKHGWDIERPEDFSTFCRDIESILQLPHLNVRGIMGMPPLPDRPEDARPYFVQIRELRDRLAGIFKEGNWDELSMGTSSDYEVAVQEGATLVRVGEAIVGPRRYND